MKVEGVRRALESVFGAAFVERLSLKLALLGVLRQNSLPRAQLTFPSGPNYADLFPLKALYPTAPGNEAA